MTWSYGPEVTSVGQSAATTAWAAVNWAWVGKLVTPAGAAGKAASAFALARWFDDEVGQLDRTSLALEPQVLAGGRVEVLLPEACSRRVRSALVDRLVVVRRVRGVGRDHDLPVFVRSRAASLISEAWR